MNFAILRTKKIKKSSLGGMASHIARTRETPNADKNKLASNQVLHGCGAKEAHREALERIGTIEKKLSRKTRKDAVAVIEVMLTASPEYFDGATADKAQRWAEKSIDWVKYHFKAKNLLSATLHMDETTPHIHAIVIPENDKGRLCAKDWLGGRDKLSAMQGEYADHMKPLELERGIKGSKAKHQEIRKWYAQGLPEAEKEVEELREEAELLDVVIERTLEGKLKEITDPFEKDVFKQLGAYAKDIIVHTTTPIKRAYRKVKTMFLGVDIDSFYKKKYEATQTLKESNQNVSKDFTKTINFPEISQEMARKYNDKKALDKGDEIEMD